MRARLALCASLAVITSCAPTSGGVDTDRVELDEFTITTDAAVWASGQVDLTIGNVGERDHTLVISSVDGEVIAATDVLGGGDTLEFTVDLPPGTYQLTCRVVVETADGRIFDHFQQGMFTDITVGA